MPPPTVRPVVAIPLPSVSTWESFLDKARSAIKTASEEYAAVNSRLKQEGHLHGCEVRPAVHHIDTDWHRPTFCVQRAEP